MPCAALEVYSCVTCNQRNECGAAGAVVSSNGSPLMQCSQHGLDAVHCCRAAGFILSSASCSAQGRQKQAGVGRGGALPSKLVHSQKYNGMCRLPTRIAAAAISNHIRSTLCRSSALLPKHLKMTVMNDSALIVHAQVMHCALRLNSRCAQAVLCCGWWLSHWPDGIRNKHIKGLSLA